MGVVFFPCLPFMGVMLFPSFVLGSTSEGGGTLFVPHFLFFILLYPLLSSSPSFSSFFFFTPHSPLFPFLPLEVAIGRAGPGQQWAGPKPGRAKIGSVFSG